ncbi:MAG: T9SS type A sorting domain-containing protein [Bacteroidota bacterium]
MISFLNAQPEYKPGLHSYKTKEVSRPLLKSNSTTLNTLPFIDDFSSSKATPSHNLWDNQQVLINRNFSNNPPTLGVATFDRLNEEGEIYSHASTSIFGADTLTSKPINLTDTIYFFNTSEVTIRESYRSLFFYDSINKDYISLDSLYYEKEPGTYNLINDSAFYHHETPLYYQGSCPTCYEEWNDTAYHEINETPQEYEKIWRENIIKKQLSSGDSIYLSFYIQSTGLGEPPDEKDSLLLDFYNPSNKEWTNVFAIPGPGPQDSSDVFQQYLIPVYENKYLAEEFRFRFRNYASFTGNNSSPGKLTNGDQWNIDVVWMDWDRHKHDTILPDISFRKPLKSLLSNYESLPWHHWGAAYATEGDGRFSFEIINNHPEARKCYTLIDLFDNAESHLEQIDFGDFNPAGNEILNKDTSFLNNMENNTAGLNKDSAIFYIKAYFSTDYFKDLVHKNDTLIYEQKFFNYYAYDDGSAEAGWGLEGEGTENAFVAYRFFNYKEDVLRGIYMHFNPSYDTTVNNTYFKLTIWDDNNGVPGNIIYQESGENPDIPADINQPRPSKPGEFELYRIDDPFTLPTGEFYIGWEQTKNKYLNIGFDVNRNAQNKLLWNTNGTWNTSNFKGAVMMRPALGASIPGFNNQHAEKQARVKVYPNPTSRKINIKGLNKEQPFSYTLIDLTGKILAQNQSKETQIRLPHLSNGFYLINIQQGSLTTTKKIRIVH